MATQPATALISMTEVQYAHSYDSNVIRLLFTMVTKKQTDKQKTKKKKKTELNLRLFKQHDIQFTLTDKYYTASALAAPKIS